MEVHSLYDEISDREQAHSDEPFNLMASSVMNMTEKLRIWRRKSRPLVWLLRPPAATGPTSTLPSGTR